MNDRQPVVRAYVSPIDTPPQITAAVEVYRRLCTLNTGYEGNLCSSVCWCFSWTCLERRQQYSFTSPQTLCELIEGFQRSQACLSNLSASLLHIVHRLNHLLQHKSWKEAISSLCLENCWCVSRRSKYCSIRFSVLIGSMYSILSWAFKLDWHWNTSDMKPEQQFKHPFSPVF